MLDPTCQPSPMHILHILGLFIWSNAFSCIREPSADVPWTEAALNCLPSETSGEDAGALGDLCARRDSSHCVLAVLVELRVPLFWVSSFLTHHVPR